MLAGATFEGYAAYLGFGASSLVTDPNQDICNLTYVNIKVVSNKARAQV